MLQERLRIELLGEIRIVSGDQIMTRFRTRKAGALLAYLAFYLQRPHSREQLIEMLWPEAEIEAGRVNFRTALASLRRQLEPPGVAAQSVLLSDNASVQFNPAAVTTDIAEFEAELRRAQHSDSGIEQIQGFARAAQLYRGELLPGCYEEWVFAERTRLADSAVRTLMQLVSLLEQQGDLDSAIDYALRAAALDPLEELAHLRLMRLYRSAGQPLRALRQYQTLERLLQRELGAAPSAAIRRLAQELRETIHALPASARQAETAASVPLPTPPKTSPRRQSSVPLHESAIPPAVSLLSDVSNADSLPRLPLQFTRFFGRAEEIDHLQGLLTASSVRLLSLTGPGGSGKTRLAITLAARLLPSYQGVVCFVPLSEVSEAFFMAGAILNALRRKSASPDDPLEQVIRAFPAQPCLLLLDNLEQLGNSGATVVKTLLERIPLLTCLVTSRHRLNLEGEVVFPVLAMPVPAKQETPERLMEFASVQLFADRARLVRPDFQITSRNAASVASLCEKLEGIPLAIELAASWSLLLSPAVLLARLENRFEMLVSRRNDVSPRHQTLWAAIAWSYALLSPPLQRFFARLSVFRGGWTLETAEAICAAQENTPHRTEEETPQSALPPHVRATGGALDLLMHLKEHSLILIEEEGETMRFGLLESLREYAGEHLTLQEREWLARRHAGWFLQLAEASEAGELSLEDEPGKVTPNTLETEKDNLRAALTWVLAEPGEAEFGWRLAGALGHFWWSRGYWSEGRDWLDRVLARDPHAMSLYRAKALGWAGNLACYRGDSVTGRGFYEQALTIQRALDNRPGMAGVLLNLGFAAMASDIVLARSLLEESLALLRESGDPLVIARALLNLGDIARQQKDYPAARALFLECMAADPQHHTEIALAGLAEVAQEQGDYAQARDLLEKSLAGFRLTKQKPRVAEMLGMLGDVTVSLKLYQEAGRFYAESFAMLQKIGNSGGLVHLLKRTAVVALCCAEAERAVCLLGAHKALSTSEPRFLPAPEPAREALCTGLSQAAFTRAWKAASAMTLEEAVLYALETLSRLHGCDVPGAVS